MLYVNLFAGQYPARHFNILVRLIWNMSDPLTFCLLNTIIYFTWTVSHK